VARRGVCTLIFLLTAAIYDSQKETDGTKEQRGCSEARTMKTEAIHLLNVIQEARPALESITEDDASSKPIVGKWSLKEILGHLIDSAANNHQRFVRLQDSAEVVSIRYDQSFWVDRQAYQTAKWEDLLSLWYFYNKHLSHVIANIDYEALENRCDMGYSEKKSLRFVVEDYIRHVQHHIKQIISGVAPEEREKWRAA
jgi:DinB superfamily